jgi:hypothetical protein
MRDSYCAGVVAEAGDISDLVRTVVLSSLLVTHGVKGVHIVVLNFIGGANSLSVTADLRHRTCSIELDVLQSSA